VGHEPSVIHGPVGVERGRKGAGEAESVGSRHGILLVGRGLFA